MIELPKRSRPATNADINIVPYIDVMLVLLVIFMMTTPIIEQGVEVDLPKGPANPVEYVYDEYGSVIPPTIITIDKNGNYYINSLMDTGTKEPESTEAVSMDIIVNQVIARMEIYPNMQVMLQGDHVSNYGLTMELISQLDDKEVPKIGFIYENVNY